MSDAEGSRRCVVSKDLSRGLELVSNLFTKTTFEVVRGEAERGSLAGVAVGLS
jgi:hypothetical protein